MTLITHEDSEGNHAQILVEGITDDRSFLSKTDQEGYFMYLTHFTGARIQSDPWSPSELEYEERTKIWKRCSQKVAQMLKTTINERDYHIAPSFAYSGCDSILSGGGHSCFTWAREKLKMADIDLGKSILGWLFTRTKNYTRPKDEYLALSTCSSCPNYKII